MSIIAKHEINRAIAELAFAIAKADGVLHNQERTAFLDMINSELDDEAWSAESRFDLLENELSPDIVEVYNRAIHTLKLYKTDFDSITQKKFLNIIERVAIAHNGKDFKESVIIERFKNDLKNL